jgi:urease accessory protein
MRPALVHGLLQLASPTLPVGAFSYSQGLEWQVEGGTVTDEAIACAGSAVLAMASARFEAPLLAH